MKKIFLAIIVPLLICSLAWAGPEVTGYSPNQSVDTTASPSFTGITVNGKAVTVTQATGLDEAVSMSSKAPKTGVVGGDGVAGRMLKSIQLTINDGTDPDTIKCTVTNDFGETPIGITDNIGKGATTGSFALNAGGTILDVNFGDLIAVMASGIIYNDSALVFIPSTSVSGGNLRSGCYNGNTGVDLTTIAGGKTIVIRIAYITSG